MIGEATAGISLDFSIDDGHAAIILICFARRPLMAACIISIFAFTSETQASEMTA